MMMRQSESNRKSKGKLEAEEREKKGCEDSRKRQTDRDKVGFYGLMVSPLSSW